jgi:hypothetical protein
VKGTLLISDFSAKIHPFVITSKALPAWLFLCCPLFLPSFRFGFFLSTGLKHARLHFQLDSSLRFPGFLTACC